MAKCDYCNMKMTDKVGCTLSVFDDLPGGLPIKRVKYGNEPDDWGAKSGKPCGDCGCPPKTFHHPGCDVETCPVCFGQSLSCGCTYDEAEEEDDHDIWLPLEQLFGGCSAPEVNAFMFMGNSRDQSGNQVWMYKHRDTRRYLWLGANAETYRPCDWDSALTTTSRNTALAMVYDGIDEGLYLSSPGSTPRFEIFPMQRNRPEVA